MVSIFKYPFSIYSMKHNRINDNFSIPMPDKSQILTVQMQSVRNVPCIWAIVDTHMPFIDRHFTIKGTGHPIGVEESLKYIGTIQEWGGGFVWHVFERIL